MTSLLLRQGSSRATGAPGAGVVRRSARAVVRGYGWVTAPARVLPDLVVIGAKRCGTTALFRMLEEHPAMLPLFPSARVLPLRENQKGVHHFDRGRRGPAWYRSHFPLRATVAVHRRRHGVAFTAEASPVYLAHPDAPARARATIPSARLVAMLRDPVARAHSHWREQVRDGFEHLDFAAALAAEPERLAGAVDVDEARERFGYLTQSRYDEGLERWLAAFDREQLLVVFSEDFYADPVAVTNQVLAFAGVPPLPSGRAQVRNAAPGAPLDTGLEFRLREQLAPTVARVERIVGRPVPWPRG